MIRIAMYTTIITLHKKGNSQRKISRLTNVNRKTIRKIIDRYQQEKIDQPQPYERSSTVDSWHSKIIELLEKDLSYVRIHEELRGQGCDFSYSSLTRYISKHNIKDNSCIRFHTKAGEEAQVDFGEIMLQYGNEGRKTKAYVFNMRLSYSRLDYYEVVFDQSSDTWIKCHLNAFKHFGGTPEVIKLDNLKAGVINANFYEPVYQKEYKRLADHYDILLSPCRVYQPQEKGKVESGIKYVKNNFFAGRNFENFQDLNWQLVNWNNRANNRLHGTTKKIPQEVFNQEEKACLRNLPITKFELSSWYNRKVAKDCHVTVDNNYYSVPSKYVATEVMIQLSSELVQVFTTKNELIARHIRSKKKGIFTTNPSHYSEQKRFNPDHTEYKEHYEKQMQNIGKNSDILLKLLQENRGKDWHRAVRGIVALRKSYDDKLIDKACLRALHYGTISYSKIKSILESNAVNLPLPDGGFYAESA